MRDGLAGSSRHTLAAGVCRGGAGWAVSRHCPALLAALWVVVAALQEWCSWEEVPPFRSPPRIARDTHIEEYLHVELYVPVLTLELLTAGHEC